MPFLPLHDTTPRYLIARPWTTWALIAGTVAAYFVQISGGQTFYLRGIYGLGLIPASLAGRAELSPDLVLVDPVVTLVTYQFLHGGTWHLLGNMLFLWVFGDNVEDAMGHHRFLVFYLVCGVLAGLTHVMVSPGATTPLIGASGAISGVLGAYLILHPKSRILVPVIFIPLYLPAWLLLIFWFGFQAYAAFAGSSAEHVGWWAHIGGFISGALLIFLFRYKAVPLFGLGDPPAGLTLRRGGPWRTRRGKEDRR